MSICNECGIGSGSAYYGIRHSGSHFHGRHYVQVNGLDFCGPNIEYNPILSPIGGIYRIAYGTFQLTFGSMIVCIAPVTGINLLGGGMHNIVRGSVACMPIFGGPLLFLFDQTVR